VTQTIRLGISTCPNDTFAFHGLLTRAVDWRGLHFEVELLDIEELNERLARGDFDVCKTSFHAALFMVDDIVVLPSGPALGFGVGPLLLCVAEYGAQASGSADALPRQADYRGALVRALLSRHDAGRARCLFGDHAEAASWRGSVRCLHP